MDVKLSRVLLEWTVVNFIAVLFIYNRKHNSINILVKDLNYLSPHELLETKMIRGCWIEHLAQLIRQLVIDNVLSIILLLYHSPVSSWQKTVELKFIAYYDICQLDHQIIGLICDWVQFGKNGENLSQLLNVKILADSDQSLEELGALRNFIDKATKSFQRLNVTH